MAEQRIELGQVVKDKITNFRGTATARMKHLFAPDQILVEAFSYGEAPTQQWFIEERLEVSE